MNYNDLNKLVAGCRSYRRFDAGAKVTRAQLVDMLKIARETPSAANTQPLKYALSVDNAINEDIFESITWAARLTDWDGPLIEERPSAYIVLLLDERISKNPFVDHGITAWTILLAAASMGLGGCMLAAFDKSLIRRTLNLDDNLKPLLIVALGKPAETVLIDQSSEGNIAYYRDADDVHHVPKRSLEELIIY